MHNRPIWLRVAVLACLGLAAAECRAQTPDASETKAAEDKPALPKDLQSEDELYILKDVAKPAPEDPKLDLGKVGKKGKLSLERMPVEPPGTYEGEPKPRGGAGGMRLKIPLGKQSE